MLGVGSVRVQTEECSAVWALLALAKCISQNEFLKMYFSKCISINVFLKMYIPKCISRNVFLSMLAPVLT